MKRKTIVQRARDCAKKHKANGWLRLGILIGYKAGYLAARRERKDACCAGAPLRGDVEGWDECEGLGR
jgi:hypothetical protein